MFVKAIRLPDEHKLLSIGILRSSNKTPQDILRNQIHNEVQSTGHDAVIQLQFFQPRF